LNVYGKLYQQLRDSSIKLKSPFEVLFYIAKTGFTLQYPVILAPISSSDTADVISKKIKMVASYLDIVLARRIWNWHSISYATLQYSMFILMRDIRRKQLEELSEILTSRLEMEPERFITNDRFSLHQMNGPYVHWLLARMTDYVQTNSGEKTQILEFFNLDESKKDKFEIEHIWANHYERHADEFGHLLDFQDIRNRIGGLLLLPKSFNASFGDLTFELKSPKYFGQSNYLAKSLDKQCYSNNPGFLSFVQHSNLPFEPYHQFKKSEMEKRQHLYQQIAELVWNPNRIREIN